MKLVLLLASMQQPEAAGPSSSAPVSHEATATPSKTAATATPARKKAATGAKKRKVTAAEEESSPEIEDPKEEEDKEALLCIPAHKLILMAKSAYFSRRLCTAVGDKRPTAVIRECAESTEQAAAMEAVVEFMYTKRLSAYCNGGLEPPNQDVKTGSITHLQRLLSMLGVGG